MEMARTDGTNGTSRPKPPREEPAVSSEHHMRGKRSWSRPPRRTRPMAAAPRARTRTAASRIFRARPSPAPPAVGPRAGRWFVAWAWGLVAFVAFLGALSAFQPGALQPGFGRPAAGGLERGGRTIGGIQPAFRIVSVDSPAPQVETAKAVEKVPAGARTEPIPAQEGEKPAPAESSAFIAADAFDPDRLLIFTAEDVSEGSPIPSAVSHSRQPSGSGQDQSSGEGQDHQAAIQGPRAARRTRVLEVAVLKRPEDAAPPSRRVAIPPQLTYQPKPKYPPQAEKREIQGLVRVRVLVSTTGAVARHEILEAEPLGAFEKSIADVLPLWRYTPALDETGKPVEFWTEYTYRFKLVEAQ